MRNAYDILGVSPGASPAEIQRAFRRCAMEWHPDRNPHPDAAARFREVVEAYEILKAATKRTGHGASYDAGPPPPPPQPEPPAEPSELERVLAEANASLRITPETLVTFFARVDALLRRAFG